MAPVSVENNDNTLLPRHLEMASSTSTSTSTGAMVDNGKVVQEHSDVIDCNSQKAADLESTLEEDAAALTAADVPSPPSTLQEEGEQGRNGRLNEFRGKQVTTATSTDASNLYSATATPPVPKVITADATAVLLMRESHHDSAQNLRPMPPKPAPANVNNIVGMLDSSIPTEEPNFEATAPRMQIYELNINSSEEEHVQGSHDIDHQDQLMIMRNLQEYYVDDDDDVPSITGPRLQWQKLHDQQQHLSGPESSHGYRVQTNSSSATSTTNSVTIMSNMYTTTTAAMSPNPYYQNLHAYLPHYQLQGYTLNPAVMTNYASSASMIMNARTAASGSSAIIGLDVQHLYKFPISGSGAMAVGGYLMDASHGRKTRINSLLRQSRTAQLGDYRSNIAPTPAYYGSPSVIIPHGASSSSISTRMPPGSSMVATNAFALKQLGVPLARTASGGSNIRTTNDSRPEEQRIVSSLLLEELKNNKTSNLEIQDIAGHVVEFSYDQHGSRFIQQKLQTVSSEEKAAVFEEVLPYALPLMTDVFGNYVIQKFLEYGSDGQKVELLEVLSGHVFNFSLQMYGCRVIQKALEVSDVQQQIKLASELHGYVMQCVRDQNGNHVIQKCIECIPPEHIQFILSALEGHVVTLSTHPYGCRVMQRVLEHCSDEQKHDRFMEEIFQHLSALAQDRYGNYVVQHVLKHGKPEHRKEILTRMAGKILQMSRHKFASNVVEKCLEFGEHAERQILFAEMLESSDDDDETLQAMMRDQYGNYVVQKLLEICDEEQREMVLSRIHIHLDALKRYTYGKHIVAHVEKLLAPEE